MQKVLHIENKKDFKRQLCSTFSENLNKYMKEQKVSASFLAKYLGVTRQAVFNWQQGNNLPEDHHLHSLKNFFNLKSTSQLLSSAFLDIYNKNDNISPSFVFDFTDEIPKNSLPVLGYATAGLLEEQYQQNLGYVEVPQKFANNEKYIAVKVSGDSMNRIFEDETITVFDRNAQTFQNKVVLVEINNQTTIKRFYDYGNVIVLKPDSYNPSHQDIIIKKEEIETLKIYGRLVYYCKEVL